MQNQAHAHKAGIVGLVGAVLWVILDVLEHAVSVPESSPVNMVGMAMFEVVLLCMIFTILGLIWAGATVRPFGMIAIGLSAFGYLLIVLGGPLAALFGEAAGMLFPIGGLLSSLGLLLAGIAIFVERSWSGWKRSILLLFAIYNLLFLTLPTFTGIQPDGPGMLQEMAEGIFFFLIALAVYIPQVQRISLNSTQSVH